MNALPTPDHGPLLVAWDGSEPSRHALLHAARLAGRSRPIVVVNVLPSQAIGSRVESASEDARDHQRVLLEQAAILLAQQGVRADVVAAVGDPLTEIAAAAARLGAEAIVVGRSRRRHLHAHFADRLIRRSPTGVVVVPEAQ